MLPTEDDDVLILAVEMRVRNARTSNNAAPGLRELVRNPGAP